MESPPAGSAAWKESFNVKAKTTLIVIALAWMSAVDRCASAEIENTLTHWRSVARGNGVLVAVDCHGQVQTSIDGAIWIHRDAGIPFALHCVAFGNGRFVAVGNEGALVTSEDGVRWTSRDARTDERLRGVTWANGLFVAVGYSGTILTSKNGSRWTQRESGVRQRLQAVTRGHGRFVAVGWNGVILTSPTGFRWAKRNSGTTARLDCVTCTNNCFVVLGDAGTMLISTDGTNWSSACPLELSERRCDTGNRSSRDLVGLRAAPHESRGRKTNRPQAADTERRVEIHPPYGADTNSLDTRAGVCDGHARGSGQDNRAPDVPAALQVPSGNKVSFRGYAVGVQIYVATPSPTDATQFVWTFRAPEAVLFADGGGNGEIAIHYAGPTWESESGSKVIGRTLTNAPAASTIPWLLLEARSTEGPGILERTTYIQRVNTTGGLAPATPPTQAGQEARVPYTAEYYFYRESSAQ
jgi:hypothetical protein